VSSCLVGKRTWTTVYSFLPTSQSNRWIRPGHWPTSAPSRQKDMATGGLTEPRLAPSLSQQVTGLSHPGHPLHALPMFFPLPLQPRVDQPPQLIPFLQVPSPFRQVGLAELEVHGRIEGKEDGRSATPPLRNLCVRRYFQQRRGWESAIAWGLGSRRAASRPAESDGKRGRLLTQPFPSRSETMRRSCPPDTRPPLHAAQGLDWT
jgi:hypothetical protein